MSETEKKDTDMRDKNLAAEERPIPSQAEGDRETVEEDLKEKANNASPGKQK